LFICIYFKLQAHMRKSVDSLVLYAYFVLWFDPIILVKEAALLRDDHQCFKHGSVVFLPGSWGFGHRAFIGVAAGGSSSLFRAPPFADELFCRARWLNF